VFQFCAESEDELDRWIACLLGPIGSVCSNTQTHARNNHNHNNNTALTM